MIAAFTLFVALYISLVLGLRIIHALHFRRKMDQTPLALLACAAWATFFYLTFNL